MFYTISIYFRKNKSYQLFSWCALNKKAFEEKKAFCDKHYKVLYSSTANHIEYYE